MAKTKVFLTGASGFLGWNFCKKWRNEYQILGTYFRNCPTEIPIEWLRINLLETKQLIALIKETKPDIVVHLAAISNAAFCEQHPALSHHINVYTTIALAEITQELGIPLIFSSTDLVFNGNSAPYEEGDFCYPLSQYGTQKQMAEEALLNDYEHGFVGRLPLMFGFTPHYTQNFFTHTLLQLQQGKTIQAFTDEFRSMISAEVAGEWLHRLIQYSLNETTSNKEKLLHLGGSESCSRYSFAIQTAQQFQLDTQFILPTFQKDLDLVPPRPADVSLNSELAFRTLLYKPASLKEQLESLYQSLAI